MKTIKKRLSAFFLLALMLTILAPKTAFAEEKKADDHTLIYVKAPADWENPHLWAWQDDGTTAFDAWPGQALKADDANEGWAYIYVPSWVNHVIVNANDGEVQTGDLTVDPKNAWITVTDADNAEVSYDQATTGNLPEYVETFKLHAKPDESWKNPCLWAWSAPDGKNVYENWPGEELSEAEDGWYTADVPTWVNSVIINGNEGSVQTEDISVDPAELWLTIDAEGKYELSYKDPAMADIPNITVHVMAPADWTDPCLWAWSAPDGTNVYANWPGEALEKGDNNWLVKEIPGWVNSIIVNGNEGSVQTTDISIDPGKDLWVVVNGPEDFNVSYEEPKDVAVSADAADTAAESQTVDSAKENNTGVVIGIISLAALAAVGTGVGIHAKNKNKAA